MSENVQVPEPHMQKLTIREGRLPRMGFGLDMQQFNVFFGTKTTSQLNLEKNQVTDNTGSGSIFVWRQINIKSDADRLDLIHSQRMLSTRRPVASAT